MEKVLLSYSGIWSRADKWLLIVLGISTVIGGVLLTVASICTSFGLSGDVVWVIGFVGAMSIVLACAMTILFFVYVAGFGLLCGVYLVWMIVDGAIQLVKKIL